MEVACPRHHDVIFMGGLGLLQKLYYRPVGIARFARFHQTAILRAAPESAAGGLATAEQEKHEIS